MNKIYKKDKIKIFDMNFILQAPSSGNTFSYFNFASSYVEKKELVKYHKNGAKMSG